MTTYTHIAFTKGKAVAVRMPEKPEDKFTIDHYDVRMKYHLAVKEAIANGIPFKDQSRIKEFVLKYSENYCIDYQGYFIQNTFHLLPSGYRIEVKEECEYLCNTETCLSWNAKYNKSKCSNNSRIAKLIKE